jgi:hypothetical protein
MDKQSLDVNNKNCKTGKLRNKIPHFKVTRISKCQWMGNDTQEWLSPIYDGTAKGVSLKGQRPLLA